MATKAVASGKTMAQSADYVMPPSHAPAPPRGVELVHLHPTIGTEVHGIDLREPLTPALFAFLDALLVDRKVIFFRDQAITARDHFEFARHWGELLVTPFSNNSHPEFGEIATINSDGTNARTNSWHSDGAWRAEPDLGSVVRAIAVPDVGGDTLFRDTQAAYVNLPGWLRRAVEGEVAVFSARAVHDLDAPIEELVKVELEHPPARHPIIRTHPVSGRKGIYVDPSYAMHIVGMDYADSRYLLERLFEQSNKPEFQIRFKWRNNSIAFWDNRGCQHYASADYAGQDFIRRMERVTIRGERVY
jgi:taurine dioxygenase